MRARQSSVDSLSVEQTRLFPVVHIRLSVSLYGQGFYFLEYMAERLGPDLLCPPVSQRSEPQYSPFQRFCSIRTYTRSVAAARLLLLFSLLPKYLEMVSIGSLNGSVLLLLLHDCPPTPPCIYTNVGEGIRVAPACSCRPLLSVERKSEKGQGQWGISPEAHCHFLSQREKEENLLEAKWKKSLRYYSFFFPRLSVLLFAACIRLSFPPPCVLLVERTKTLTPLPARIIALMIKSREENGKRIDGRQGVGHVPGCKRCCN